MHRLTTPRAEKPKQIEAPEEDQWWLLHRRGFPKNNQLTEGPAPGKAKEKRCSSPLEAVGDCQDPLLGNEDAATDVPTGLTLQGALPGPPSRATGPAPEDPLGHSGSRAASTVYQRAGEAEARVTHPQTQLDTVTCK